MIDPQHIEELLAGLESDSFECKESLNHRDDVCQAICAFANDLPRRGAPGYVLIGMTDRGFPSGLTITDRLLCDIGGLRDDGKILPIPHLVVERVIIRGKPVAVVEVTPAPLPPVRYDGRVWIRVGPRRGIATVAEEKALAERAVAATYTFDQRACLAACLDDLDAEAFRGGYVRLAVSPEVLRENQRSVEHQLASLRFFDAKAGVPTHAGIVVFGRDPQQFVPGAYVQFVRFDGPSRADRATDTATLRGTLAAQLRELDALLPRQIQTARVPDGDLRYRDAPDYPLTAVREVVTNALLHRTYDGTNAPVTIYWFTDRVEVLNPGGLYGAVTAATFGLLSDYRNPILAEVMKHLGYVERFGTGIAKTRAALDGNGNPAPQFDIEASHVCVTLRAARGATGAATKAMPTPPDAPLIAASEEGDLGGRAR